MPNNNFNFTYRQGYGPINANLPPVDPNNSTQAIAQGLDAGSSLGLRIKQLQLDAQEAERKQQYLEIQRQQAEDARFNQGIDLLTNKQVIKNLRPQTRKEIMLNSVIPGLSKRYGIDIDPSQLHVDDSDEDGPMDKLMNLIKTGAPSEVINREYQLALMDAEDEDLQKLRVLGDTLPQAGKSFYFVDPSTKSMFDQNLQPISEAPAGASPRMLSNPAQSNEGIKRTSLVSGALRSVNTAKSLLTPSVLNELKGIKFTPGKIYQQLASSEGKKFYRNLSNAIGNLLYIKTGAAATPGEIDAQMSMYMVAANDDLSDAKDRLDMLSEEASLFKGGSNNNDIPDDISGLSDEELLKIAGGK